MGTADMQGQLWGRGARHYADIVEPMFQPAFEMVFTETQVIPNTTLLDVGCGPGLAAALAATRGALVAGLDAATASIEIARERTPSGDFRVGDMERLPWADSTFDVVTSFNAFQFAANVLNALREARRVAKPLARVAMLVWGPDEQCDTLTTMRSVFKLLPQQSPPTDGPPPLSMPGRIEQLMVEAELDVKLVGEVECPFRFPDLDTAVRGLMSSGGAASVAQHVGAAQVQRVLKEALTAFRNGAGEYVQRNTFRYVIAVRS